MNSRLDFNIIKYNTALFLRSIMLLTPVLLLFYQENGLTAKHLFFFQGIFYLTSILSEVPVGYISDLISRKIVLIISFCLYLTMLVFWFNFSGYYVILFGEILFAISKVMMDNAMPGYLYDYLNNNDKPQSMVKHYGYLNFYLALGTAVGAVLGTYLYAKFGSGKLILTEIMFIVISIFLVLSLPKIKSNSKLNLPFYNKIKEFCATAKGLYTNNSIKWHVMYSGFLTSLSILFAISFQPLMQNALFPVFMYGVVAFSNHGIRALSGIVAGKWLRNFDIRKLIKPLFVMYTIAFLFVFLAMKVVNFSVITCIIFLLCLIIGVQLIFTILHVSRLQKFVQTDSRGNLMSVNNFVSRFLAAAILISSKVLTEHLGIFYYFVIVFVVYLVFGTYLMINVYRVKE